MGQGASAMTRTGWDPSAKTRTELGSCRLGNCTFVKWPLGKIPLGSRHLGQLIGNVSNIYFNFIFYHNSSY